MLKVKKMALKLVLATNSPRRQELMRGAGFQFEVFAKDIDESIPQETPTFQIAKSISQKKNQAYRALLEDEVILTSDTVVIHDNKILGKPKNTKEAFQMLSSLSGKSHQVISAVTISSLKKNITFDDITEVFSKPLSSDEINFYIEKYKPYDKAGAYGIQEWIGMIGIKKIIGSYYNVMGMPIDKVYDVLKVEFEISPL